MRFQTIIYLGLVIKTVTGTNPKPQYEFLKSKIMGMCQELTDKDIAEFLPVEELVLLEQLTLVPELGGEDWKNEVCFYLRHIKVDEELEQRVPAIKLVRRYVRNDQIYALLYTAIARLIATTAKGNLYEQYIAAWQADKANGGYDILKIHERFKTTCPREWPSFWDPTILKQEKFATLPIEAQSAIYFASYGLANPGKTLAETDKIDLCRKMGEMMSTARKAVIHGSDEFYYLMAIGHAAKVLELVDRPMPPLGQV